MEKIKDNCPENGDNEILKCDSWDWASEQS